MAKVSVTDPRRLLLAGDWHANNQWIQKTIRRAKSAGCDAVVQLGDTFYAAPVRFPSIRVTHKACEEADLHVYWIDGNHDCHRSLAELPVNPATGFKDVTDRVHYIPRGTRWVWNEVRFLGLGGAFSVDKDYRLASGAFWSPDETITYAQAHQAAHGGEVDVMFTHDVPLGVPPHLYGVDDSGDRWPLSTANRQLVRWVVDETRPRLLVHGHYHRRYSYNLALEDGHHVQVEGLHRDTFTESWEELDIVAGG